MSEKLNYLIEDKIISELLGNQNFTNSETAIFELVKNAYDALAENLKIEFTHKSIVISDDGKGMSAHTIRRSWMHIGKSDKKEVYALNDEYGNSRVLTGSMGLGRFALCKLGARVKLESFATGCKPILWTTDWNESNLKDLNYEVSRGTSIEILELRERWTQLRIDSLCAFLNRMYRGSEMKIYILSESYKTVINQDYVSPKLGFNSLSVIDLSYNCSNLSLTVDITSNEFSSKAKQELPMLNLERETVTHSGDQLISMLSKGKDLDIGLLEILSKLGDFTAQFGFSVMRNSKENTDLFYNIHTLPNKGHRGVALYKNSFGIVSYDGAKDWLGLGKRSRMSPAAATHPTGLWRVRENQIFGRVLLDKKDNRNLKELSNRQGYVEDDFYKVFVALLVASINVFERYRQNVIRRLYPKTISAPKKPSLLSAFKNGQLEWTNLSDGQKRAIFQELKDDDADKQRLINELNDTKSRYKYDVRLLNALATSGLKSLSLAHELQNDESVLASNNQLIVRNLKDYGLWSALNTEERSKYVSTSVPRLLEQNIYVNKKVLCYINILLENIKKTRFKVREYSLIDIFQQIRERWRTNYPWLDIDIDNVASIQMSVSLDMLFTVFDNLILNSIQQNDNRKFLIVISAADDYKGKITMTYRDTGQGLPKKYVNTPMVILEPLETSRAEGHGLGMWIVNNMIVLMNGAVETISGKEGFKIQFTVEKNSII